MNDIARRRDHWLRAAADARWAFQFGQDDATSTGGGSRGCTHVCIQLIEFGVHGRRISQDEISRLMLPDYPTPEQRRYGKGPLASQVVSALNALHLRYEARFDLSPREVVQISKYRGPVIFGCSYLAWPEWRGARYNGLRASGHANGFARPAGHAGRTQLGDNFSHAGLLLGAHWRRGAESDAYLHDPNHASGSRRERPAVDVVTRSQFNRLYSSGLSVFKYDGTPFVYAVIPKETLHV